MGERDGSAWVLTVSGLILVCNVVGVAFIVLYLFRPKSESPSWFPLAGLVILVIPWCFWLLNCLQLLLRHYLHRWLRFRSANNLPNGFTARINSTAVAPEPDSAKNLQSPVNDSPHGGENDDNEQRHVHFGAVIVMGNEEQNGHQSGVEGHNNNALGNKEGGGDHSHNNTGSTLSTLNDQDLSFALWKGKQPISGASSSSGGDHSHNNTGSTSGTLNDQDLSIALWKGKQPITGASTSK